jgi:hypothetical protein
MSEILFGETGENYVATNKKQRSLLVEQESSKLLNESKFHTEPQFTFTQFHIFVVINTIMALQPFVGPWLLF